jgi:uncharacterized repeat protein (TIGR03803 family)
VAGTYSAAQSVTISTTTSGATIRYTTDGSTPTESAGTLYSSAVTVSATETLKAIAYAAGYSDSTVGSAAYTITQAATPSFSPAAGTFASAQSVTITTATVGATIHYTIDGSTPTETHGTAYSSPVSIANSAVLKAIAYKSGLTDSTVASGIYTISSSPAAILNVIDDFTATGGINPQGVLVQGTDGSLYGTTMLGGTGDGTVFKTTLAGVLTSLDSFAGANGNQPVAGMIQGTDGNFYGTTSIGGTANDGTVFKMTSTGTLTTLVSFTGANGSFPAARLLQGTDGNFYGTTGLGGSSNVGTVFKITPTGTLTTLASFTAVNGAGPNCPLVQGTDGNFYGTTTLGGSTTGVGDGVIFKVTPAGVLTDLVILTGPNGAQPSAGLILNPTDGNFYGTTNGDGGATNLGTFFKMTPAGVLTVLATFNGTTTGSGPNDLVLGTDGNFYGTTEFGGTTNNGTVFRVTPAGALTILVSLDGANGNDIFAGLIQGTDGNFYGTTNSGGVTYVSSSVPGDGVVYQLIVPPAVVAPVFSPVAGTYTSAQTVTITTATSGASIVYTTDGTTPIESGDAVTHGTLYTSPLTISATTTLKALAFKSGDADSPVTSGVFTIAAASPTTTIPASGGGGGGALDAWFLCLLGVAGILRWRRARG